jgi:transposase
MSKVEKSDMDHQEFWRMVLETFTSSGLSVRQFCQQEGLSEASFYAWPKRLAKPTSDSDKEVIVPKPFIQVSLPKAKSVGLELVLASGHTLRIPSDTDRQTLMDVLFVLSETGFC